MAHGYDWIWILDADSAPRRDALEQLLPLYEGFPPDTQRQIRLLAGLPVDAFTGQPYHATRFTPSGCRPVRSELDEDSYEFEAAMYAGWLFKVCAIRQIGFPAFDYFTDCDDYEYAYRGKCLGLWAFLRQSGVVEHNIGRGASVKNETHSIGPLTVKTIDLPPSRVYYSIRNSLFLLAAPIPPSYGGDRPLNIPSCHPVVHHLASEATQSPS